MSINTSKQLITSHSKKNFEPSIEKYAEKSMKWVRSKFFLHIMGKFKNWIAEAMLIENVESDDETEEDLDSSGCDSNYELPVEFIPNNKSEDLNNLQYFRYIVDG